MAYVTKDTTGLIQLWNNKPKYANNIWLAWIDREQNKNEIGIDVTENNSFNRLFNNLNTPCALYVKLMVLLDQVN